MLTHSHLQMQARSDTIRLRSIQRVNGGQSMNRSWGADQPVQPAGPGYPGPVAELPATGNPDPAGVHDLRHFRIADELAPMVEVWERLLALHVPDRTGRCRTCTQGGTGLPGTPWPCALHGVAELARRRHAHAQGA